jgi:amidase/6-aminohexanoate-cyclic-dimer hydrolase
MLCDTTFDGAPIDDEVRAAVQAAGRLLADLGHGVEEGRPRADVAGMMRAWTDIVACGTALTVRGAVAARGRPLEEGELEGVARGALAHAAGLSGADYLAAVGVIHAFGREMAAVFDPPAGRGGCDILLSATLAEPPARIGRFGHATTDYVGYRMGPAGVFAYSPFCAAFNASGQPAASVPLGRTAAGLPVGIHLAARFGADEELIALCAELEAAAPWAAGYAALRPPGG